MVESTSDASNDNPPPRSQPAPQLLDYATWYDERELRYVASYVKDLPGEALDAGCLQVVTAATVEGLTQAAVRNRIRIECWKSGQAVQQLATERAEAETRFVTGDLP